MTPQGMYLLYSRPVASADRNRINAWYGIRYAEAPVGNLRWQAPRDIDINGTGSRGQVIDAVDAPLPCHQGYPGWWFNSTAGASTDISKTPTSTEDCLNLDILAPAKPANTSLPVIVQIHGGGYTLGSSSSLGPGYELAGNALVYQSSGGIIYVSIQYRLGAYGFLGGAEVAEKGVANAGLLDQRAALGWVQRHISKFGGDPAKVTIMGGSAGGGSVTHQLTLHGGVSNPPFRGAIAEYPWLQPLHSQSTIQRQYELLLTAAGCPDIQCLRAMPESDLAVAAQKTYDTGYALLEYGFGDFYYGPYVDGEIIRGLPSHEFSQGHFAKVPLLTNREGYEGVVFSNSSQTTSAELVTDLKTLFPGATQSFVSRLLQLYPRDGFNSTFFQRQQIFGDFIISCFSQYMAAAVSDRGEPVYKMIFDAGGGLHGSLVPFTETVNLNGTSNNATLASIIRSYYISFATQLDPNAVSYTDSNHPHWPTYQTGGNANLTVLSITDSGIEAGEDPDNSAQCDFFHGQSYVVRN
ncbi:carboxylesterase [Metarhizium anisopliae]|nr:carboxylesterase [Metarhizium anisopliae]